MKIRLYIQIFYIFFTFHGIEDTASTDESHQNSSWSEQRWGVIPFRSGRVECVALSKVSCVSNGCICDAMLQHPEANSGAFCVRYTKTKKNHNWRRHTVSVFNMRSMGLVTEVTVYIFTVDTQECGLSLFIHSVQTEVCFWLCYTVLTQTDWHTAGRALFQSVLP